MLIYIAFILTIAAIYALLAQSLVIVWGQTGMVNLGLAGFFAVGAYAFALAAKSGVPVPLAYLAAMAAGAVVGLIVTLSTLRLREDYLAIVTLGFAEVVRIVASNEIWLTGGTDGISGLPAPFDRNEGLVFHAKFMIMATLACLVAGLVIASLGRSPWGRVLRAIREDQIVDSVAGKSVVRFKAQSFMIGSAIAALAGALYGSYVSYIAPDLFQPLITIYIFLAATAGGNARVVGAVAGAYLLVAWLEASRFLGDVIPWLSVVQIAALREMSVGVALVLVLRYAPGGIFSEHNEKAPR
jgi:branched-chain amino acid transport system permease protein